MPYLLLGAFALWFIPPIYAVYKMDISFESIKKVEFHSDYIRLAVNFKLQNNTIFKLTINNIKAKVFIEDNFVLEVVNGNSIMLAPNSSNVITAILDIPKAGLLSTIFWAIADNKITDIPLSFVGSLIANKTYYPFSLTSNLGSLIDIPE
jgi:hypothetical protein